MTQKIFKKSNKEDMKLLFSILPDRVNYIYYNGKEIKFIVSKGGTGRKDLIHLINIDFETESPEEMVITRSDYE